jgi:hypothetical protein
MPWQIVRVRHDPKESAFSPVVLENILENLLTYRPGGKVKTASAGNLMVARMGALMGARNFSFTIGGRYVGDIFGEK